MPDDNMRRRVLKAVLGVAAIAVVIGVVIALATTLILRMAGFDGNDGQGTASHATESTEEPSALPQPKLVPTKKPTKAAEATSSPEESTEQSGAQQSDKQEADKQKADKDRKEKTKKKPENKGITLAAGSKSVGSMQRVTLSGSYPGGDGTVLRVQRKEGGQWVDFPTSATVDGRHFDTYVALGQPGANKLRVVAGGGKASNVVTINVS